MWLRWSWTGLTRSRGFEHRSAQHRDLIGAERRHVQVLSIEQLAVFAAFVRDRKAEREGEALFGFRVRTSRAALRVVDVRVQMDGFDATEFRDRGR